MQPHLPAVSCYTRQCFFFHKDVQTSANAHCFDDNLFHMCPVSKKLHCLKLWHLFRFLSFRLYMFLFSFFLLTCDHLKFKRSVVHKSAHSNALIPFFPAPLSHLVQLEIIYERTSVLSIWSSSIPCLRSCLLPCFSVSFSLIHVSVCPIFPHHFCFNPSSEMVGDTGEVGDLEQGICEDAILLTS